MATASPMAKTKLSSNQQGHQLVQSHRKSVECFVKVTVKCDHSPECPCMDKWIPETWYSGECDWCGQESTTYELQRFDDEYRHHYCKRCEVCDDIIDDVSLCIIDFQYVHFDCAQAAK